MNIWKRQVSDNRIAFLTHYWKDPRFADCDTVTKAGCKDLKKLAAWGEKYGLQPAWIDKRGNYPHFDLFGDKQLEILEKEGQLEQLSRFHLQ